jgi:hypothetical protein
MKRPTKAQREERQKAALLQRLNDIYSGAMGQQWSEDDFATAEILSRVLPVVREAFGIDEKRWVLGHSALHYYDKPDTAAEMLYCEGVRA